MTPSIFWLLVFVLFAIGEAATVGLTSIWFAFGGLCALIASGITTNITVQVVVFLAATGLSMLLLRPMVQHYLKPNHQATNADRIIGKTVLVTMTIDNILCEGEVQVHGQLWSAQSAHDVIIPAQSKVRILEIQGVRLIVEQV